MIEVEWKVSTAGSPHAVILGMSGQGKSRTIKKVHREFTRHAGSVVLDFHGDLAESMRPYSKVINVATEGLPFNPFLPSSSDRSNVKQFCLDFGDILQSVCGLGDIQKVLVYKALLAAFESSGFIDSQSADIPTMGDFVSQLELLENSNKRAHASARIIGITEFELFRNSPNLDFEKLEDAFVIDLSNLGSEELKRVCAGMVLRKIYSLMYSRGQRTEIDFALFVDEAHLLSKDSTVGKLFKEARKFGISVILASQSIGDFHDDVKDNAGLKMVFRMNNPTSAASARFLGGGEIKQITAILENLDVGECLVRLREQNNVTRIKITD
jgi:DNA phosphorothioation-dependent restriction protein DptH